MVVVLVCRSWRRLLAPSSAGSRLRTWCLMTSMTGCQHIYVNRETRWNSTSHSTPTTTPSTALNPSPRPVCVLPLPRRQLWTRHLTSYITPSVPVCVLPLSDATFHHLDLLPSAALAYVCIILDSFVQRTFLDVFWAERSVADYYLCQRVYFLHGLSI